MYLRVHQWYNFLKINREPFEMYAFWTRLHDNSHYDRVYTYRNYSRFTYLGTSEPGNDSEQGTRGINEKIKYLIPRLSWHGYFPVRGQTHIQIPIPPPVCNLSLLLFWSSPMSANKWYQLLNTCIIVSIFRFSKSVKRSDHSGTDDKNEGQWWV